ncbi:AzlD domain-containing protein [Mameliella sediminis]|uniref:AzlD domain-containing protein n=1 Tax=Mameliella sediminis TaxID=2836866 RepID=UPI001C45A19B|nr:AzlD domain-containing protein [Mameliella sediminis]MBY6113418.1 AzlD domain-containing protein [Antarctobacter heliothermus]MBY6143234.1 AzlD domain-containing protein [Mameliella alba]MBV7394716.1 AzlD domain-containing protein [Mameliella sediminis]MBY6163165.1 AzlD domain-containing protein [Mameliella alba]MBY6171429.1 AzlD domain-containing protein [Mameliella alba]
MNDLWIVIIGMGLGSFGLRFVFLGLVGDRAMPDWLLRHLRYTAVAVMPALVAPLVVWPTATGGETDPLRLVAAAAALIVGYVWKSLYGAVAAGAIVMIAGAWLPF